LTSRKTDSLPQTAPAVSLLHTVSFGRNSGFTSCTLFCGDRIQKQEEVIQLLAGHRLNSPYKTENRFLSSFLLEVPVKMPHEIKRPQFRLLDGVTSNEVSSFLEQCRTNNYSDGTCLFRERTEARTFYLILIGAIELRFEMPGDRQVEGTTITKEGPGGGVGWSVFVPPYTYSLSGYCRGQTHVLEISKESFDQFLEKNSHLAHILMRNIAWLIGERLFRMQDTLARYLGTKNMSDW